MIVTLEDILDELEKEYPEITRESLKKICKKGLTYVNNYLKSGEEIMLYGAKKKIIKMYKPMSPDEQVKKMRIKYYVNKKRERDAKNSNDK